MCIFLCFSNAQLGLAELCKILAHNIGQVCRRVCNLAVGHRCIVLRHADIVHMETAIPALKALEIVVHKDAGHLAGTVGAEVQEDYCVALGHTAALTGHAGHNKFIGHAVCIAAVNAFLPVGGMLALVIYKGGIGFFLTVPVAVTVHGIVAARNSCDLADTQLVQLLLHLRKEALAVVRVSVTAIHDSMDIDVLCTQGLGHVQQAEQVVNMAVHAAVAHKAHKMDSLARVYSGLHVLDKNRIFLHLTIADGLGDKGELLVDDAACTDVGVADLRVAHLPVGQANTHTGSADGGIWAGGKQLIKIGRIGCYDRVAVYLIRHPAKAVQNTKKNRFF